VIQDVLGGPSNTLFPQNGDGQSATGDLDVTPDGSRLIMTWRDYGTIMFTPADPKFISQFLPNERMPYGNAALLQKRDDGRVLAYAGQTGGSWSVSDFTTPATGVDMSPASWASFGPDPHAVATEDVALLASGMGSYSVGSKAAGPYLVTSNATIVDAHIAGSQVPGLSTGFTASRVLTSNDFGMTRPLNSIAATLDPQDANHLVLMALNYNTSPGLVEIGLGESHDGKSFSAIGSSKLVHATDLNATYTAIGAQAQLMNIDGQLVIAVFATAWGSAGGGSAFLYKALPDWSSASGFNVAGANVSGSADHCLLQLGNWEKVAFLISGADLYLYAFPLCAYHFTISVTATCGNGVVDPGETCDGDCPTSCPSVDPCAPAKLVGSAATCDAHCTSTPVTACASGDGCCPTGCTNATDSDCSATCGNGVVDPGETCDGDCPTSCPSADPCAPAKLVGSAANCDAHCTSTSITACASGDGCCPAGCTNTTDSDCSATCGNGVVDPGETCDGNCPTSCPKPPKCYAMKLVGNASACNVSCQKTAISACVSGDGCCPAGCTAAADHDCAPSPAGPDASVSQPSGDAGMVASADASMSASTTPLTGGCGCSTGTPLIAFWAAFAGTFALRRRRSA
jgi:MYXO-CTERM domain-containing protein